MPFCNAEVTAMSRELTTIPRPAGGQPAPQRPSFTESDRMTEAEPARAPAADPPAVDLLGSGAQPAAEPELRGRPLNFTSREFHL